MQRSMEAVLTFGLKIIYSRGHKFHVIKLSSVSDGQMSNESNEEDISTVDACRTQRKKENNKQRQGDYS